jgi:predicted AlkP superfamily phosphohydrolase/phosphomutase
MYFLHLKLDLISMLIWYQIGKKYEKILIFFAPQTGAIKHGGLFQNIVILASTDST